MKNLFAFLILFISISTFAQEKAQFVEVDYEMETVMDADEVIKSIPAEYRAMVEGPLRDEIKNGIFMDYKMKMNKEESVYKLQEKIVNSQDMAGMILAQMTQTDKGAFYKNYKENFYLKEYDFGFSAYLVKDSLPDLKWTITREKDEVAGFEVRKATGQLNDTIPVTAWFAPKLTFSTGPDRLGGLPGLILKAEMPLTSSMSFIWIAKNINVKEEDLVVDKPAKGKVVSQKEFDEEMIALQKQYQEMQGGGVDTDD